ncbi:hypothetical protein Bca52824_039757 [Brassica carinata]|uniref:Uncharacterized protein n=1 Tax=Brassica carinata TaxID=52824 RepID=A0A8X7RTL4_BRACI|nr:hypothetical protein Bca52824_039757 [Brassica carinata]
MASGRKRLRNLAAETHPTYGETFLDRTDPSASSSGTASAQENVTESQSQGRSSAQEYVPPAQYVHLAQYELPPYSPQYEADFQPQVKICKTRLRNPSLRSGVVPVPEAICSIPVPQSELDQSMVGLIRRTDMLDMSSGWYWSDYDDNVCPNISVELVGLSWTDSDKAAGLVIRDQLVNVWTDWCTF